MVGNCCECGCVSKLIYNMCNTCFQNDQELASRVREGCANKAMTLEQICDAYKINAYRIKNWLARGALSVRHIESVCKQCGSKLYGCDCLKSSQIVKLS